MISMQVSGIILAIAGLLLVFLLTGLALRQNQAGEVNPTNGLYKAFFEENAFPTVVLDRSLTICLVSNKFRSMFMHGLQPGSFHEMFAQKPFADVAKLKQIIEDFSREEPSPQKPVFINLDNKLAGSGNHRPVSYLMIRKLSKSELINQDYLMISFIDENQTSSILEDMTTRIERSESNLKKLEELDRLKSEFLATLSHELKTPLVSIKGYLDLMATQKMGPLTEKQEKALRISLKNTSHLNNLISSILNFARMEAGKLKFDRVNQKISSLINDIIDSLRPIAEAQRVRLEADIQASMPAVSIDSDLIHRVISNLIENSIKFSPPDSEVLVRATPLNDEQIRVEVIDHGCGIPADKLEYIKAPFYQADKSDTRPTGGLGLGLAIAEKILIGHGTTLIINSTEGQGTNCSFILRVGNAG
ncbi:MAG TPA: HAMP domain-containing sensor histidine kinase [Candidatus Rifleibacterium sp.]|nr:HAMP domain-containing sensor histidine kinase [Candidatus Rifleibacterium sp.]HPT45626.1 HAMP domain-containing sensor histidine kinase [Candidatus Rifleibacterium sp.]